MESNAHLLVSSKVSEASDMKQFTAVIERDGDTGLYVGWVPGFPGAHSQGATVDELQANLQEVVEMLLEEGDPHIESVFIGTHTVEVA
jgi:predicted RNase H-like HicB family nuclease